MVRLLAALLFLFPGICFSKETSKAKSKSEIKKLTNLGLSHVVLKGKYRKHDKKYIYLSRRGVKKLVKVPRAYLTSSPKNLKKNQMLRVELPLARLLLDNQRKTASIKR